MKTPKELYEEDEEESGMAKPSGLWEMFQQLFKEKKRKDTGKFKNEY